MSKKLYVGNLSYDLYDNELKEIFQEVGQVEKVTIIFDNATGRSKGFGFVEMSEDAAALKAIESLNGREIKGRKMIVNEARPQELRRSGGGRSLGSGRRY